MSISKVKSLFSRSQYPLHHGWLELAEKSISTSSAQEELLSEISYISKLMGSNYVDALKLMLDSDPQLLYKLLPLKLAAKKRIATSCAEFSSDCDRIVLLLSKHVLIGSKTPQEQRDEQRQIQSQRILERRESSERIFREQKAKYEKNYIDFPLIDIIKVRRCSKAATVLQTLTKGKAIADSDYLWLKQNRFANELISEMYYLNRAKLAQRKWEETKKPWNLVNAIADYRKAHKYQLAVSLANKHLPFKFANRNKSLKSALLTTSGGAKRDLFMFDEAIKLGMQAHELTHQDYRPCTLIGACKILSGDIAQGHEWYKKAIKRGFNPDSFEQELRSIYNRADRKDKAKIKRTLNDEGWRYQWLNC